MKDRISLFPGRYKIVPVEGKTDVFDLIRADEPEEEGTPLNKNTLLKDTTAFLYGLGTEATPDNVFEIMPGFIKNREEFHVEFIESVALNANGTLTGNNTLATIATPIETFNEYVGFFFKYDGILDFTSTGSGYKDIALAIESSALFGTRLNDTDAQIVEGPLVTYHPVITRRPNHVAIARSLNSGFMALTMEAGSRIIFDVQNTGGSYNVAVNGTLSIYGLKANHI